MRIHCNCEGVDGDDGEFPSEGQLHMIGLVKYRLPMLVPLWQEQGAYDVCPC